MQHQRSKRLFGRAQEVIPGGVNSPVRAFRSVGGDPIFVARGEGPYIYDVDGNRYIDYVGSWGPLILGHAPAPVTEALLHAVREGTSFGATTAREVDLAERVTRAVPSVEKVRFVSSGTEATMSALRLARAVTGRPRLLKFAGCYHGHADAFLVEAGSGVATLGIPGTPGVPASVAAETLTLPYNDLAAVEKLMAEVGNTVAAIMVEPIACNMGLVQPVPGFLEGLRSLCDKHKSVLIFDEVITGFRVQLDGAQGKYRIRPDLTTFGKVIGGGLPVGAFGGRADLMNQVAPLGPVYQAGTLSGNPLAMAAGIAALEQISRPGFYEALEESAAALEKGMQEVLAKHQHIARFDRVGSIFYLWFKKGATQPPRNFADIKTGDAALFGRLFHELLEHGVSLAPSAFEVGFVSAAHQHHHLDATINLLDQALHTILS